MSENPDRKALDRFLSGFTGSDSPQSDVARGDPQAAALAQYLQGKVGVPSDRVVVDFGSGFGVAAKIFDSVFKQCELPLYVAVDKAEWLDKLSLPTRIHNHSKKVSIEEFYQHHLATLADRIVAVIIRNVLHELVIKETALLFWSLAEHLAYDCEIYVQDMIELPRLERGFAGWIPDILKDVLTGLGHEAKAFEQTSYGGTNWFALEVRLRRTHACIEDVERAFAEGRRRQHETLAHRLAALYEASTFDLTEMLRLNTDMGSISTQLVRYRAVPAEPAPRPHESAGDVIPTVATVTFAPLDYVEWLDSGSTPHSGLVAILSNKRLLDLRALFASAMSRIMMVGFSLRSLFNEEANVDVLVSAALRGVSIRLLLASPTGAAVNLRSSDVVYSDTGELGRDIRATISGAEKMALLLAEEASNATQIGGFSARLFDGVPYASYFIIDDLCFVSLYSRHLSGSRGGCLVFRHSSTAPIGYFDILLQEFEDTWASSGPVD